MRSYAISIPVPTFARSIMGRSSLRSFGEVSYCTGRPALGDRQRGQLDLVPVSKIPDANPMKPLLRAIEHLDAYATAYRYPSPRGRVKPAPSPAELDRDIANIDRALAEIAARFQIDASKSTGPAGKSDPIR